MSDNFDDVLIVVPCLNEEAHLPGLLAWLVEEAPGGVIVVADGGSRDRSRAIVEQAAAAHGNIRLLDNPLRIQSAGINRAAALQGSGRDWLVRIDAHCDYPRGYVAGLLHAARTQQATSVVVPMVTKGVTCFQLAVATAQNSVLGTGGSLHRHAGEGRWVDHGHHALFRVEAFLAAGGYDESFSHNEDAELDARLTRAGGRIWLEGGQAITYYPRRAPMPLLRQYFGYGKGRARNLMRHRMRIKLRQAVPLLIAPLLLVGLVGLPGTLLTAWAALLVAPTLGYVLLSLSLGALLALRQRSLCALASGFAAMVMHAGWSAGFWWAYLSNARPGREPEPLLVGQ